MNDAFVLDLSEDVVEKSILLRKRHKIKLPDVIIAATALSNNFCLVTRNVKDFDTIEDLIVINPWESK
jgi:hypothetical protein